MSRKEYDAKINAHLKPFGISYDGKDSKTVSKDFFELMLASDEKLGKPRIDLAIVRAERNYINIGDHSSPASEESSTTVFELVKIIKKHML
jgi:hypothetical protein